MNMCICITESLCCTPKINIVNQLFVNKFFLKKYSYDSLGFAVLKFLRGNGFICHQKRLGKRGLP